MPSRSTGSLSGAGPGRPAVPRGSSPIFGSGGNGTLVGGIAAAGVPLGVGPPTMVAVSPEQQQGAVQEFRRLLEETRREVREIKAAEANMRWNMERHDKATKLQEQKEHDDEIRDWRQGQQDAMNAYIAEKTHETKLAELQDSRNFVEFKREVRGIEKAENQKIVHETYLEGIENAVYREAVAKELELEDKEVAKQKIEKVLDQRDIKKARKISEQQEAENNRRFEADLEMSHLARQLAREKDTLLQSLEHTRACHRAQLQQRGHHKQYFQGSA